MAIKLKTFTHSKQSGQSLLLSAIWHSLGGPTQVAHKLGINIQSLINWKTRKKVPLEKVGEVSRKLGIEKWGLNFEDLHLFLGDGPTWEEVVNYYKLPKPIKDSILSAKRPRNYKELTK